jgi:hypothetical protein
MEDGMAKQAVMNVAELRRELESGMSEDDLLGEVIDIAHERGYIVAHFRPAQTQSGRWHTAVQADGAGYPDLVLVRPTLPQTRSTPMRCARVVYAELKSERGRFSPEQRVWLKTLRACGQEVYEWKPSDLERIRTVLM